MNILIFNQAICIIEQEIECTHQKLIKDTKFFCSVKPVLDRALNDLLVMLKKENYPKNFDSTWHAMCCFVRFKKLYSKVKTVQEKILKICTEPYFVNKIKYQVLPLLSDKFQELRVIIGSQKRLPFSVGIERAEYHEEVRQILLLKKSDKVLSVVKDYFHLLANHLDDKKLKAVKVKPYSGSLEIFSLESWREILTEFIKKGDSEEKRIGNYLSFILKKTIDFALKSCFTVKIDRSLLQDEESELSYFEKLTKLLLPKLDFASLPADKQTKFSEEYLLKESSSVPKSVIINEIAWDMLEAIQQMQEGELRLFTLGTFSHSILVQVNCIKTPSDSNKGDYHYKIFNTGSGVDKHHQLDSTEQYAYPLSFENLKGEVFSYSFCAELVRIALEVKDVDLFYDLHDNILLEKGGGTKQEIGGSLYFLQKHATCTYSAIEAWINSFLTKSQSKHLELIKTRLATRKQTHVVKMLQSEDQNFHQKGIKKGGKPSLEESQVLLRLGRKHLKKVKKEFHLNRNKEFEAMNELENLSIDSQLA